LVHPEGDLPSGAVIAQEFGRGERWGRPAEQAGLAGHLDALDQRAGGTPGPVVDHWWDRVGVVADIMPLSSSREQTPSATLAAQARRGPPLVCVTPALRAGRSKRDLGASRWQVSHVPSLCAVGDGGTRKPVRIRRGPATVIGERIPNDATARSGGWEGRDER